MWQHVMLAAASDMLCGKLLQYRWVTNLFCKTPKGRRKNHQVLNDGNKGPETEALSYAVHYTYIY